MRTTLRLAAALLLSGVGITAARAQLVQPYRDIADSPTSGPVLRTAVPFPLAKPSTAGTAGRPLANPVVTDITSASVVPNTNTATVLNPGLSGTDADNNLTGFRFATLPPAAQGTLQIANAGLTAYVNAATATNYTVQQAQFLRFVAPTTATPGTTSFTFQAYDATGGTSNTATYRFQVAGPVTADVINDVISSGAGPITLAPSFASTDATGTVTGYVVNSIPNTTTQGTLALNGTPVTVNQVIPVAQIGNLTFDPVSTAFGSVEFTYSAQDASMTDLVPNNYSIPVAKSSCADGNAANFRARTTGEDWKTSRTLTVEGVNITSTYTSSAAAGESTLSVVDGFGGKTLSLTTDYTTNATATNNAVLTLTLNRAVNGFTFAINDIDKLVGTTNNTGWEDLVKVDGYQTSGAIYTLTAADIDLASNGVNVYSGSNLLTGTGNSAGALSNVVITFPVAINKVVITYRNGQTSQADPGGQIISLNSFGWCAQADVTTSLTGPGSLSAGIASGNYTVTYTNGGPDAAEAVTRTVTIPANTASAVSAPTGTVTGSQAAGWTITYPGGSFASGNSVSYNFSLTPLPVASIAVTSNTSTATDENGVTSNNSATNTTNVTPVADVTTTITGPGSLTAGLTSGNYTVTYTNNGPSTAASTTRTVTIPSNGNITSVSAPNGTVTGTAATTWTITFPAGSNVASGNTVSYNYTVTPALTSTGNTVTSTSNTSTTTSQGNNTAADAASVAYTVGAVADVSAAFTSGQADNSTVVAGTTVTYGVTFTNAGPSTAAGVTRTVSIPAGVPSVTAATGTVTGSQAAGWTITYPGGTIAAGNSQAYSFSLVAPATGPVTLTTNTTTTTSQGANALADAGTRTLNVTPVVLSGRVYDDVNYSGGAGRNYAAANTAAQGSGFAAAAINSANTTVELYDASGNYVTSTTTAANGTYSFNLPSSANYTVRVVNGTVESVRALNSGASATGLIPVQTFVLGSTNKVGGEAPEKVDAPANNGTQTLAQLTSATQAPQSLYAYTAGTAGATGVNFGFSFDVISNKNDAGQGSLRQFILNSNALSNTNLANGPLAGTEYSVFMIPDGLAHPGLQAGLTNQLTNGAAVITLASTMPNITDAATALDGSEQTTNVGDTNAAVTTAGSESTGPEVILNFNGTNGMATTGDNTRVVGMGFTGANAGGGATAAAFRINDNNATVGAANAVVQNNTFYSNGANLRVFNANNTTISGNISRNALNVESDGVEVTGMTNSAITGNQFLSNAGYGIDFIAGTTSGNTISNNLFSGNGQNTGSGQTAGVGIRSNVVNNTFTGNTFTANVGDGISARNGSNNVFSQNSFYANGNLGIDLTAGATNDGDGVTLNDTGDADANTGTANGLVNFPIITSSIIRNGNLLVQGYARPGVTVELFVADPDATGFGEGKTYFSSFVEGSAADTDAGTGTYSGLINGLNQGTDNTNRFTVSIPLSSLTTAQQTALTANGAQLTATATQPTGVNGNYGTSEFSGNAPVQIAPVPNTLTNASIPTNNGATVLNPNLSATAYGLVSGTSTANSISYYTITALPTEGTLTYNGTVLTSANIATTQILPAQLGTLTYTPVSGTATSSVSFSYTATDANGITSSANNNGGTVTNGPATYTIPLTPVADVTTTLAGTTQVIPGSTNTYTVTYTNNGPNVAAGVTRTITLPAGSTNITAAGGTVAGTTITYPTLATQASGNTTTFNFSFTPPATAGNYALSSNVGTTTSQGANAATDVASLTINVAGAPFDCNSAFFRVRQPGSGNSVLERLDRTISGGTATYTGNTLYTAPAVLNALAFNYADGYLYAFAVSTNTLYRLSSTGAQNLGPQASLPATGFNAATSDLNGVIYLANNSTSTIYKMTPASNFAVSTLTTSAAVNYGDMAYNPIDNSIYAVRFYAPSGSNGISRINPTTGAVTVLGTPATAGEDVGSMFCDAAGAVYIASNQGSLVYVNPSTGDYTLVGSGGSASQSDGASCVFPTQDIDVVLAAGTPVRVSATSFDVTYTVRVGNTGVTNDPAVQVNNFLNNGSSPAGAAFPGATSVTVVTAPAVTAGTALAVNSAFNGTTNTGLLAGTTDLPSGANSTITYTVRVTYPSVAAIPTTAQNNSVYASTVATGPNGGYTLINGVAVPPSAVLAGDQSTNGSTLPSTTNGDTPSPTPVTFSNPLAQDITNVPVPNTSGQVVLNPNLSATPGLNGTGPAISSFTVTGPVSNGTLRYNGTVVTGAITVPIANLGLLTYQPTAGFSGNATFPFSATDASGGISNTATYTIPVQNLADVTTAITGPTQLSSGVATGTYTVTYANVGTTAAAGVTRTVTLPSGATLTTAQQNAITAQGGSITGSTINFGTVTSLAAGASSSFTFSFTAPTAAGTAAVTSSTSTTSNEGANTAPNSSTINATVNAVADVVASIAPISGTVSANAAGTGFNVTFTNSGALTAAGVTRTVQLPAGLSGVTATNGGSYSNATGLVTYTATSLASGASLTSTITFTAPASGPVPATATIATTSNEAGQTANNAASASIAINPAFDLTTTIYGPATAVQGNEVILNVTTTNNGPSAAPNAQQTVQLIAGLTDVYVSGGGSYNSSTGLVTFPAIGSLPSGQTVANTISFKAPTAGTTLAPQAVVTPNTTGAGETNTGNNTAYLNGAAGSTSLSFTAPTAQQANVYTTISASAQPATAGGTVTLTVVAANAGPSAATSVVETVQLQPGLTITTLPSGANYNGTTGLLTLPTIGSLAPAGSQTYTIGFTAPANAGNNGQLLITAAVSTLTSETVAADNVASTVVTVTPTADVATAISGPATTIAGQQVTYTATFANNGQGTAAGVTRTAQIPAGLTGVVVTDVATGTVVSGAYNSASGLVTLPTLTSQTAGTSAAYTISFAAPAASFGVRSATGTSTVDGVAANNSASASTTVSSAADVATAISGPATAVAGNPVTYSVTTTNNGPNPATGVATTLQLPAGLTGVTVSNGGNYSNATGLVTFTAAGTVLSGSSVTDYVTFTMPATPSGGQISGVASVTSTSTDPVAGNNNVSLATSLAPNTSVTADLATTVTLPASATAGASVTATATFTNNGTGAATNVTPSLQLPAGLTVGTISNGGSYNSSTGLVTWPTIASQASGNTATYTVAFTAPGAGPVRAASAIASQTSDNVLNNNSATASMTITASYDAVTSIGGPASSLPGVANTYTVTATNNGPSVAPSVTQTVTLPAGVTATNISNGGTQTGTTITWPAISNLAAGATNAVAYTFSATMPASGSLALTAGVTSAGESNAGNNSAPLTTTQANQAPVSRNVVNTLQTPEGSTAGALDISPLAANDADGSVASYALTSIPTTQQGVLYYNNAGTYTAITSANFASLTLTPTQASSLRFDPAGSFIGNVFFTYTSTDNLGAVSNAALYTIPVGQDLNSLYTNAPNRGGSASNYSNGDLIAGVVDLNTARYSSAGTMYDNSVANGTLVAGADNGLRSVSTDATGANLLASLGLTLNATNGEIRVTNRTLLRGGSYSLNITTVDANGGTNTQLVTFSIGFGPLPVTLVSFEARSQQSDAVLSWKTAQEKNNDHFDVERSSDGVTFTKVGQVAGNGTSTSEHLYGFTDRGAASLGSKLYYRLRQVDADGTPTLSDVRMVSFGPQQIELAVFPNPTVDLVNVRVAGVSGPSTVTIYNTAGAVVLKGKLDGTLSTSFDVRALPAGAYLVKVQGSNNLNLSGRFVKN